MTTIKKSTRKSFVDNTSIEDDDLDGNITTSFSRKAPFDDDDDEFDLPLDDLDTLDSFDSEEDDEY
jgi:hypothetical protein